jgi:hypothetical protein
MALWRTQLTVVLLLVGNLAMVAGCAGSTSYTGPSAGSMMSPGMFGVTVVPYSIGPGMFPGRR